MAIADELALLKSTKASIKEKLTNKDLQPTEEFSTYPTVNIIEPNDGFYLTNKENPGDILSKKVFLAANDSAENWVEISIEEGVKDMKPIEAEPSLD